MAPLNVEDGVGATGLISGHRAAAGQLIGVEILSDPPASTDHLEIKPKDYGSHWQALKLDSQTTETAEKAHPPPCSSSPSCFLCITRDRRARSPPRCAPVAAVTPEPLLWLMEDVREAAVARRSLGERAEHRRQVKDCVCERQTDTAPREGTHRDEGPHCTRGHSDSHRPGQRRRPHPPQTARQAGPPAGHTGTRAGASAPRSQLGAGSAEGKVNAGEHAPARCPGGCGEECE